MFLVSRMTGGSKKDLSGLTYKTLSDDHRKESRLSWNVRDVIASATVLVLIIAAYLLLQDKRSLCSMNGSGKSIPDFHQMVPCRYICLLFSGNFSMA